MIEQTQYIDYLKSLGRKFSSPNIQWEKWFEQYLYYEGMWENYFENIFIPNLSGDTHSYIELVFWESCPGGMPFPHQNYAFDEFRFLHQLDGSTDSYLKNVCSHFNISWQGKPKNKTIRELLIEISKRSVLIVDLYPTHGITLDNSNRNKLYTEVFPLYTINKLSGIGKKVKLQNVNHIVNVTGELNNAGVNNRMDNNLKAEIQMALGMKATPEFYQLGK